MSAAVLTSRSATGSAPAQVQEPIPVLPPIGWRDVWPWVLGLVVTAVYSTMSVERYLHGTYTSWDLAIFTQGVDGWAHGHLPVSTVRGGPGYDLLGDHFSPALALLAPGYRLFPSPVYLLVCQAALFGASVVPIARLAGRRLGQPAAVLIALAYSVSWGLQQAVVVDFHEVALAVPLLAAGGCALVDRRWRAAAAWLLPLVLVKEDLGVTVALAGAYIAWQGARRLGGAVALTGAAATALEMAVLIPAVSPDHHYRYAGALGGEHSVLDVLAHTVWPEPKPMTLFAVLGITAFVCLRSPLIALALPTLLWRFESDNTTYWGRDWHYSAVLMPIVFVAAVDGLHRLRSSRRRRLRAVAAPLPAVIATIAAMSLHTSPLDAYASASAYRVTERERAIAQVERVVPAGAVVETDIGLMSHLVAGRHAYFVGNGTSHVTPDFVVLDQSAWGQSMVGAQAVRYAHQLHPQEGFRVLLVRDGITVVQRVR